MLASTIPAATLSAPANDSSTARTFCWSVVKSVRICRLAPIDATATRSAGDIFSFAHATAASAALWRASGCIELVSKSITQMRWPATSTLSIGPLAASTGDLPTPGVARMVVPSTAAACSVTSS